MLSRARFTPLPIASAAHRLLSFLMAAFGRGNLGVMILCEKSCLRCLHERAPLSPLQVESAKRRYKGKEMNEYGSIPLQEHYGCSLPG